MTEPTGADPVPPRGAPGDNRNYGIQNVNSTVTGTQAAGSHARATQIPERAPAAAEPALAALVAAVRELQANLDQLRAEQPQAVSPAQADDAATALERVAELAATPDPDHGSLRRWVNTAVDALGQVTALTTAVAALRGAIQHVVNLS